MLLDKGLLFDCALLVYIDDWIIMAATEELVRANMQSFDTVNLHPTKRDGPTQSIDYIGFLLMLAKAILTIMITKKP